MNQLLPTPHQTPSHVATNTASFPTHELIGKLNTLNDTLRNAQTTRMESALAHIVAERLGMHDEHISPRELADVVRATCDDLKNGDKEGYTRRLGSDSRLVSRDEKGYDFLRAGLVDAFETILPAAFVRELKPLLSPPDGPYGGKSLRETLDTLLLETLPAAPVDLRRLAEQTKDLGRYLWERTRADDSMSFLECQPDKAPKIPPIADGAILLEVVDGAPSCIISQLGAIGVYGYRRPAEIDMRAISNECGLVEIKPARGRATGTSPGAKFFAVTCDPEYGEPVPFPHGWTRVHP